MAAGKENEAPPPSAVVSRRQCYAVKSCGLKKRPGRPRWVGRVPLRDITNLIAMSTAAAEAPLRQESSPPPAELAKPGAVLPAVTVQDGVAGGAVGRAARYSLRKEFR
ncbi:uncharacterized protein LOC133925905 [Phragmites australis]|uniref:uncharacterized protein LOC133925905 n=1 Tax=Phragmites australis TaxID=29695 RepID=UPI002D7711DB|nr:uncharacterized protein LOC133925905 [Phragmites australis]